MTHAGGRKPCRTRKSPRQLHVSATTISVINTQANVSDNKNKSVTSIALY